MACTVQYYRSGKDRINSARVLGVSEFQILLTVIWPSVIPYAFTGARLGLGGAFASIVAAEMLSSKEGIGYLIFTARMYFHTDWIITGVIVLGILGYLSDKLLRLIGNNLLARYGVREKKAFKKMNIRREKEMKKNKIGRAHV